MPGFTSFHLNLEFLCMSTFNDLSRSVSHRLFRFGSVGAGAAALVLAAGMPATVVAQDDDYYEGENYEYEPSTGVHEEEWYDPSDWFDDEWYQDDTNDVDFEEEDWDYGYDYMYDDGYTGTYDYDYDAYYDGYYDGYDDDEYGMDDNNVTRSGEYGSAFTDGYYDGYYDQQRGYDADPYYYVYVVDTTGEGQRSDQQRRQDETRERGDRMKGQMADKKQEEMDRQDADRNRGDMQRDRQRRDMSRDIERQMDSRQRQRMDRRQDTMANLTRERGTVDNVTFMTKSMKESDYGEGRKNRESDRSTKHHIAKVAFEDGSTVYLNLGPNMGEQRFPVETDERSTFIGTQKEMQLDNERRQVLTVYRIVDDGETIQLRGPDRKEMRQKMKQRDRDNTDRDRQNRNENDRNRGNRGGERNYR